MKNLSVIKNLAVLLLLCISISSCKENKEEQPAPAPDLATKVQGIYTFYELEFDGKVVPADESNLKGDIRITKKTDTTVDAKLDIRTKNNNEEFMVYDVTDIKLKEFGNTVELVYEGETVAKISGKRLIVNGTDETGTDFTITATR
ncbi:hypothetical protein [Dyadobacter aurulentus]|uniref:hypothetical protein n=1 Tax=Dyadobacter sp. UC 10 TaxID=2605428 RepID=UPI0011F18BF6|nr:hypothetical protein [Dyadobacter sp. UC 10]KAA0992603.1 hypothetical protein FXO21_21735 [Dyadobacter sp. UC 10]